MLNDNIYADWAYDIDKDPIHIGENRDTDTINQSIEMILATNRGERLFNPSFGFGLMNKIFDLENNNQFEKILDDLAKEIMYWDNRIQIVEKDMKIIKNTDQHSIVLIIPYYIKINGIASVFKKKIG